MAFKKVHAKTMTEMVLDHFKLKGDISNIEAQGLLRCRSLSRRVSDLKEEGHIIKSVMKTDSTGQRYARYFYHGHQSEATDGAGVQ